MDILEAKISNTKKPLYNGTRMDSIHHLWFDNDPYDDDVVIPNDQDIKDQNTEEFYYENVKYMEKYIRNHIVLPGKDTITVLIKVKVRKRVHSRDLVVDPNKNPILDAIVYDLKFQYGRVEEYLVKTILEYILEEGDNDGWDTGILS